MATETSVLWEPTLSLDRKKNTTPTRLNHISHTTSATIGYLTDNVFSVLPPLKNSSFLHSHQKVKQDIVESRNIFLNLISRNLPEKDVFSSPPVIVEQNNTISNNYEQKKTPIKKISFKVKKTPSIYRAKSSNSTTKMTPINNRVAELAMKFDEMEKNSAMTEQTKVRKLVKRVNSQRSVDSVKVARKPSVKTVVTRKPSVKTKPVFNIEHKNIVIVKRKPAVSSVKKVEAVNKAVRAKIGYLEKPQQIREAIRPTSFPIALHPEIPVKPTKLSSPTNGTVRATIEIFERRNSETSPTKIVPKRIDETKPEPEPEPNNTEKTDDRDEELVQIVNIPAILPQRRCDSMYETLNLKKIPQVLKVAKSEEAISRNIKPNTSFLWTLNQDKSPSASSNLLNNVPEDPNDWKSLYDFVDPNATAVPAVPARLQQQKPPPPLPNKKQVEEKIYEELNNSKSGYESCESGEKYEVIAKPDDGYEYCESPEKENIYETLPVPRLPSRQQQPLPPRPPSRTSYCTIQNGENISNCYESIYSPESNLPLKLDLDCNYESIYGSGSNRDSLVSSDIQSNSLYGRSSVASGWGEHQLYNGKATSDLSSSDRSDDWVDVTDNEDTDNNSSGIIIIREKHKFKKSSGWSQQFRDQWSKSPHKIPTVQGVESDKDHLYESLCTATTKNDGPADDDYDSFDSDTQSESSFSKLKLNMDDVDIGNNQLPEPPNNQPYGLTRLAATAGKHMRKLRRNWSLTKNDISRSLSRMTKRKSRTDLETAGTTKHNSSGEVEEPSRSYQNMEVNTHQTEQTDNEKNKSLTRKGFLNKFRRSMSLSAESASELTSSLENKPKSTFYLTQDIDIDGEPETCPSPTPAVQKMAKVTRPQSPPPPAPQENKKRATSWYAEVGLFKNSENSIPKRPNTFWYAEVGLYQPPRSTPSTSSAENSGNNVPSLKASSDFINQENSEEYHNMKNGNSEFYYNHSITSFSSTETKKDASLTPDIQLRLQDEPLYQFYDAAVLDSVCHDATGDFDSDGYEEVGQKSESENSYRPSAMDLVTPSRNSIAFSRTLWCEVPEVIQSSVLSTLSTVQKKLQEAKFEMLTSEASYLNSLNVLLLHFFKNLQHHESTNPEEIEILFGKIEPVKNCSEKLLLDLENCWQDNIVLHGVCDIIQKHAEENFYVYVTYCENQILLDETLKKLKERPGFLEVLKQLESSSACQSLTLYSFLMLPMQRITRWPLLVDAVLKRLSPQDTEYVNCQYALSTMNKIVNLCNEGARNKERENELFKISLRLEFDKSVPPMDVITENRWLVRSGPVTQMIQRNDEIKLTFGKKFIKSSLHLFLFNDFLFVTKPKSDNFFTVIHYCPRNLIELNSVDTVLSLPVKDSQGRHLIFLTLLENQKEKTVEFLLSCSSESDQERWIEALSPPKSEDPNETLYECWDCPQVTAIHNYSASQPDELALSRGDTINVLRKMADGWYHGERIRDGQTGWFPSNYTMEVANPHTRSRNLKQRYRLLAFSENYLKSK